MAINRYSNPEGISLGGFSVPRTPEEVGRAIADLLSRGFVRMPLSPGVHDITPEVLRSKRLNTAAHLIEVIGGSSAIYVTVPDTPDNVNRVLLGGAVRNMTEFALDRPSMFALVAGDDPAVRGQLRLFEMVVNQPADDTEGEAPTLSD